jgi:hypothetical protein
MKTLALVSLTTDTMPVGLAMLSSWVQAKAPGWRVQVVVAFYRIALWCKL